jgi:hypothetical protein
MCHNFHNEPFMHSVERFALGISTEFVNFKLKLKVKGATHKHKGNA